MHLTSVLINYSSSVMLKILIKVETVYERFSIIHISNQTKYLSDWYVNLICIPIIVSCEFQVRGQITSLWITDKTLSWTELHWERSVNYISGNLPQTTFFNCLISFIFKKKILFVGTNESNTHMYIYVHDRCTWWQTTKTDESLITLILVCGMPVLTTNTIHHNW